METNTSIDEITTRCCGEPPALVIEGFHLFDEGMYFEAHEVLETAWRQEKGPMRNLYRGVLQVAVGYYHLLRGNYIGARKMFARCRPWLASFPAQCFGIDLAQFQKDFELVDTRLLQLEPDHLNELDIHLLKPLPMVSHGRDSPNEL